jgi:CheY-like chemotaxis protein
MIVDDEPTTIEVLEVLLQAEGFSELVSTTEPEKALELISRIRPDLLLLNLWMPEIGGLEILAAMRQDPILAGIPVVILTSSSDAGTKRTARELGAADFLGKPVDPSELALRVRNTLALRPLGGRAGPAEPAEAGPRDASPLAADPEPALLVSVDPARTSQPAAPIVSRLAAKSPRFAAIAEHFAGRLEEKLAEMDEHHRAGRFEALAGLAHWLRGAAGTVGFDAFTAPAESLRTHAGARDAGAAAATIDEIRALAARIARPSGGA